MTLSRERPEFPSSALGWGCGVRSVTLQTGFSGSEAEVPERTPDLLTGSKETVPLTHRFPCSLSRAPWGSKAASSLRSDLRFAKHFHAFPTHIYLPKSSGGIIIPISQKTEAGREKVICPRMNRCQSDSNPTSNSKFSTISFRLFISICNYRGVSQVHFCCSSLKL